VFHGLVPVAAVALRPPVTGAIREVGGTPEKSRAAPTGAVSFDLKFDTLKQAATGTQTGLERLSLALGGTRSVTRRP
jgi:hypothetical protein